MNHPIPNCRRGGRRSPWLLVLLLPVLLAASPHPALAQEVQDTPAGPLDMLRTEGLENSQLMETLSWLTDISGGRLTNSPSMYAAINWIESRLAEWGIERVWREPWGPFGQGWTNERAWARIAEPSPSMILMNVEPWTGGTDGVVKGPAVLVSGITSVDDLEQYRGQLQNAFVLLAEPPDIEPPIFEPLATRHSAEDLVQYSMPRRPGPPPALDPERMAEIMAGFAARDRLREIGLEFFAEEGAAAMVVPGQGTAGTIFLDLTYYGVYGPRRVAPLPVLTFTSEHYGRITRMLDKGIPVVLEAEVVNSLNGSPEDPSFNVLAELPRSDKADEVVPGRAVPPGESARALAEIPESSRETASLQRGAHPGSDRNRAREVGLRSNVTGWMTFSGEGRMT